MLLMFIMIMEIKWICSKSRRQSTSFKADTSSSLNRTCEIKEDIQTHCEFKGANKTGAASIPYPSPKHGSKENPKESYLIWDLPCLENLKELDKADVGWDIEEKYGPFAGAPSPTAECPRPIFGPALARPIPFSHLTLTLNARSERLYWRLDKDLQRERERERSVNSCKVLQQYSAISKRIVLLSTEHWKQLITAQQLFSICDSKSCRDFLSSADNQIEWINLDQSKAIGIPSNKKSVLRVMKQQKLRSCEESGCRGHASSTLPDAFWTSSLSPQISVMWGASTATSCHMTQFLILLSYDMAAQNQQNYSFSICCWSAWAKPPQRCSCDSNLI